MTSSEQFQTAARLWQEHRAAEFPACLRGAEFEGIDMVMLDADTAGCTSAWVNTAAPSIHNASASCRPVSKT
ncbi:hypothetical protein ACWCPJ_21660 [Streptomyces collinus]